MDKGLKGAFSVPSTHHQFFFLVVHSTTKNLLDCNPILSFSLFCCFCQSLPCQFPLLFQLSRPGLHLFMLLLAFFKQIKIHFQEHFPNINGETMDCLVPMRPNVLFQWLKNDWENDIAILGN